MSDGVNDSKGFGGRTFSNSDVDRTRVIVGMSA